MANYIYVYGKMGSEWIEEYNTLEEATQAADYEWGRMNEADRKACDYAYILKSANPDEEADDHLNGEIIKVYREESK